MAVKFGVGLRCPALPHLFLRQTLWGPSQVCLIGTILSSSVQPAVEKRESQRERSGCNGKVPNVTQRSNAAGYQVRARRKLTWLRIKN